MPRLLLVTLVLTAGAWGWPARGEERVAGLVRLLPREANAVAIVRVAEVLKSERAVRENWAGKQAEEFLSGGAAIPPWVETLVVGSLVHPSRSAKGGKSGTWPGGTRCAARGTPCSSRCVPA
jgi:hypothetical protein